MKAFPTSLENFRNCPRKYLYERTPEIRAKYRKPSVPAFVGMCIHDALEEFFDPVTTPVPRRTHETLVQYLRNAWAGSHLHGRRAAQRREERRILFGSDRATEKAVGEKAKHLLWRFVQTQDVTVVPFTTEQFHEIPFAEGRHVLAGKVDRVDRLPDGTLKVLDYKTGKSKPLEPLRREDIQLATYALIVARKFRTPVSRCAMLFLAEDQEVGWTPDEDWLREKEAEIAGLLDAIEREDRLPDGPERFAPTPNPLCGWCDYRELCPPGQEYLAGRRAAEAAASGPAEEIPF